MEANRKPEAESKKILVVEDERIIAINICSTLKQYGYKASYVSEAADALSLLESESFDLVLMDIMLNGDMDGIEIASKLKKFKSIPVIYLTAYSDETTLNRAKTTEPFGYLIKPFNSRDLYIAVEMAIYKSQVQNHIREVESRLAENQKWETVGLVASGFSHEVNNPLTSIINLADLIRLESQKKDLPQIRERSEKIMEESERISSIIRNLVLYSQSTSNQWTYANLVPMIQDTRSFLHQYFLKEGIQVELDAGEIPEIYCQPQRLKQVFLNLIQDARQRILQNGGNDRKIHIRAFVEPSNQAEQGIFVSLEDSGKDNPSLGIANLNSLEVSRGIIAEHKGKLERNPEENRWEIRLPLSQHPS